MMEAIVIRSMFGHEIMACNFAQAYGIPVVVSPNKDNEEEYYAEAEKIARFMSYFTDLSVVPFADRQNLQARDIIAELKEGKLADSEWMAFFGTKLEPAVQFDEPELLAGRCNILVVPQKLISDNECGVTAEQQSLSPVVFKFLKEYENNYILGQHFNKVSDLEAVKKLAREFKMTVPGLNKYPEILGIRGVEHRMYHNMYASLSGSVGIAGTHTWILLTAFPEIPQVILYNKNGVENWQAIARAARRNGRKIYALGFDENTDMQALSIQIKNACKRAGMIIS